MALLLDHPQILFGVSLLLLWISSRVGTLLHKGHPKLEQKDEEELVLGATLTLLALIIAFTCATTSTNASPTTQPATRVAYCRPNLRLPGYNRICGRLW